MKHKKLKRPGWHAYFMSIAHVVATRSNCIRRQVAAVLVKDHRIVSTGYNGTPKGIRNCCDGGCPRCSGDSPSGTNLGECVCCHAEENAITQAAYHGISIQGATLYTTTSPCLICAKMIINSGIRKVIYQEDYRFDRQTQRLFAEAGVSCSRYRTSRAR